MGTPIAFPPLHTDGRRGFRTAALIGTAYDLPESMTLAVKPAGSTLVVSAATAATFDVLGLYRFTTTATGETREIVALDPSVRTHAFFAGADGLVVWRSLVVDPAFEAVDLTTVSVTRPWPTRSDGRILSPVAYGANTPGSYEDVRRQFVHN